MGRTPKTAEARLETMTERQRAQLLELRDSREAARAALAVADKKFRDGLSLAVSRKASWRDLQALLELPRSTLHQLAKR